MRPLPITKGTPMKQTHLNAAALSFISYDETHAIDKILSLWNGDMQPHFVKNADGSHFFGLAVHVPTKIAYVVSRGTDGDDRKGELRSWLNNANVFTGADGMHNGFQVLANTVFNKFKEQLPDYKNIVCCGHSQGAGVSQIVAKLCMENLSKEKQIDFAVFATPPAGKKEFADCMQRHFATGRLTGTRYTLPGDPIASKALRNKKSWICNGVDTGTEVLLPDLISYDIGVAELVNHSCRMYTTALLMQCAKEAAAAKEVKPIGEMAFLGNVFKMCIN